jgi:hypothetical protein
LDNETKKWAADIKFCCFFSSPNLVMKKKRLELQLRFKLRLDLPLGFKVFQPIFANSWQRKLVDAGMKNLSCSSSQNLDMKHNSGFFFNTWTWTLAKSKQNLKLKFLQQKRPNLSLAFFPPLFNNSWH